MLLRNQCKHIFFSFIFHHNILKKGVNISVKYFKSIELFQKVKKTQKKEEERKGKQNINKKKYYYLHNIYEKTGICWLDILCNCIMKNKREREREREKKNIALKINNNELRSLSSPLAATAATLAAIPCQHHFYKKNKNKKKNHEHNTI